MSWNGYLILFIFIYVINNSSSQSNDQNKGYSLISTEWEIIKDGWPIQDIEDSLSNKNTQFFYNNFTSDTSNKIRLKIPEKFKQEVKDKNSGQFKISFKIWYSEQDSSFDGILVTCGVKYRQRLSDDYNKLYKKIWMPYQCVLSYEGLKDFEIEAPHDNENTLIAFKDFRIEYEEYEITTQYYENIQFGGSTSNDVWKEGIFPLNWTSYIPPTNDEMEEFFFFSNDCFNGCQINSSNIRLPKDLTEKNLTKVTLSFEYYLYGSEKTSIQIFNNEIKNKTNDWKQHNLDVSVNDYNKIIIKINIANVEEKEFIGIKNLKVSFETDGASIPPSLCDKRKNCKWTGISESLWSTPNEFLKKDKKYYYPTSKNNQLTIRRSDDLSKVDVCFNLAYRVTKKINSLIKIYYQNSNEEKSNLILEIKPKIFDTPKLDESNFCMRDIIALNVKDYSINIVAEQIDFQNGVNDFALSVEMKTRTQTEFDKNTRKFLTRFTKDTNWKEEWAQLIPNEEVFDLEIKEDVIHFNAKPESFNPTSAILLSKNWISNSPTLFSIRGKYTLIIPEKENIQRFKITPRICDWLFQCFDVRQRLESDKDNYNVRTYSFDSPRQTESTHIKLLFYVEYYTNVLDNKDLSFDLKLEHFGDPCYADVMAKCKDTKSCQSNNTNDLPNEPKCEKINNCRILDKNTNHSGDYYCKKIKQYINGCENFGDTYRCICKDSFLLNWNLTDCVPPETLPNYSNSDNVWDNGEVSYSPNKTTNNLEFKFKNVNSLERDICFEMKADIFNTSTLVIFYKNNTNNSQDKKKELYSFKLSESSKLNFCVRDFLYKFDEKFIIIFEVEAYFENSTPFTAKIKPNSGMNRQHSNFMINTDNTNINSVKSITDILNVDTSPFLISAKVGLSGKQIHYAYIITEWIDPKQNFNTDENYFYLKISENVQNLTINQKILFANGPTSSKPNLIENDIYKINGLKNMSNIFKIILEITFQIKGEKINSESDLLIKSISIGDPCQKYDVHASKMNLCKGAAKCEYKSSNEHKCSCDNGKFGQNCEVEDQCKNNETAVEMCQKYPSVPFGGKCETLDLKNTTCKCVGEKSCVHSNKSFKKISKYCTGDDCEFLVYVINDIKNESLKTDMLWYNKNLPEIESEGIFYRTKINKSLEIQVKSIDQKSDACLNISYILSENAKITLKMNDVKLIDLGPSRINDSNLYSKKYNLESEYLCLRKIFGKIEKDFKLSFSSNINGVNDFFAVLRINEIKEDTNYKDLLKQLPYLTHLNDDKNESFSLTNQWPIKTPTRLMSYDKKDGYWTLEDMSIEFKAKEEFPQIKESYLISQWLQQEASKQQLKFKIKKTDFNNYVLKVVFFDEKMQEIEIKNPILEDKDLDQNAIENNNGYTFSIPPMKTSFRIGLKISLKPLSLTYENKNPNFIIEKISLADPCFNSTSLDKIDCGFGSCIRKDNTPDYYCNCTNNSNTKYTVIDRKCIEDKCKAPKNGDTFCNGIENSLGCVNDESDLGFHCKCKDGTDWISKDKNDPNSKSECRKVSKCLVNKCDLKTQICHEKNENETTCVCNGIDYFNVDGKCEKYNPCVKSLRFARNENEKDKEPCGNPKLNCHNFGLGEDDYICVCPEGFINIGSNFREKSICTSIACSFPSLNTCKQNCIPLDQNGKNYNCSCYNTDIYKENGNNCEKKPGKLCNCENGAFCKANENDCQCKDGYDPVKDSKGKISCTPKSIIEPAPGVISVCPSKNMTISNNELACLCGENYVLNDKKTCDLKPICGKDGRGRKDCFAKDALCETSISEDGTIDYKCSCTADKEFNNVTENYCIDKCKVDDRDIKCLNLNAECDPTLINETHFKINESMNEAIYCLCRPGFVKNGKKCWLASYAKKLSISIKVQSKDLNDLKETPNSSGNSKLNLNHLKPLDLEKYTNDLVSSDNLNFELHNKSFTSLKKFHTSKFMNGIIAKIFSKIIDPAVKYNIGLEKCLENSNNFYDCTFVITVSSSGEFDKLKDIKELFQNKCPTLHNNPQLCYIYLTTSSVQSYYESSTAVPIVIDYVKWNQSEPILFNSCNSPNVSQICIGYSYCDPEKDTSRFSCSCNEEYFAVSGQIDIEIQPGTKTTKTFKKTCKVRNDLCKIHCGKKNETCIQTAPIFSNNKWTAEPKCSCAKNFTYTQNGNITECTDVCVLQKCYHGTCKPTGDSGATCICNEGWNGDECDSEKKASLGGWIAGIVILAVLVVIASGIAMFFARKSRNSPANHNGHTLDEYSGSSYRVGQTGQPRGQPAYSNPSFHRE